MSGRPLSRRAARRGGVAGVPLVSRLLLVLALLSGAVVACATGAPPGASAEPGGAYAADDFGDERVAAARGGAVAGKALLGRGFVAEDGEAPDDTVVAPAGADEPRRLMTYQADFSLLVSNVDGAVGRFLASVEAAGGHLGRRSNARLTVRVPAARFFEMTEELRTYGRVLSEQVDARDITAEYVDLESGQ